MLITNNTNQDYWFDPLHLPATAVNFLVDDTTATSLYLTDDSVADAINFLYAQVPAKITVSSQALPFPRPTGKPDLVHGDGSPEGLIYASEGTLFLRRDRSGIYKKSTMVHVNTGWDLVGDLDPLRPAAAVAESIPRVSVPLACGGFYIAQYSVIAEIWNTGSQKTAYLGVGASSSSAFSPYVWKQNADPNGDGFVDNLASALDMLVTAQSALATASNLYLLNNSSAHGSIAFACGAVSVTPTKIS